MFTDSLGATFSSVGSQGEEVDDDSLLIFDAFGSYTEQDSQNIVPLSTALAAADRFLRGEAIENGDLSLEPD